MINELLTTRSSETHSLFIFHMSVQTQIHQVGVTHFKIYHLPTINSI